jgi:DNA-binding transcriptional regulator YiaG
MKKKYKSEILQVIHEDAVGNFEVGAINAEKMKEFDELCLEKEARADKHPAVNEPVRSAGVYAAGG